MLTGEVHVSSDGKLREQGSVFHVRTELQGLEKPVQLANDGIVGLDQRAAQARQSSGEQDVAIRVYDHMLVRKRLGL